MRKLVYTMFVSNNCPSFNLWWKKNLVKHRKVKQHYGIDYLKKFALLFMFLITTKFVKNRHISARVSFIFLKNVIKLTWNFFNSKFQRQWKDRGSSYQVRQILGLFRHLIVLNFSKNRVKGIRVIKNKKKN